MQIFFFFFSLSLSGCGQKGGKSIVVKGKKEKEKK
jgi:hypothetical protein